MSDKQKTLPNDPIHPLAIKTLTGAPIIMKGLTKREYFIGCILQGSDAWLSTEAADNSIALDNTIKLADKLIEKLSE